MSFSFNWIEYATCGSLLVVSALIGFYYGCIKGNQNTVTEYMLGGKTMSVFPIAMSLIASHVSGITLIGVPAEVYEFGTQFLTGMIGVVLVVFITNKCYVPVFHSLQLYSVFEYLEMRFSKAVRKIVSFMFALSVFLYVPMVIYLPSLAFNQVTGISVHYMTPVVCLLCMFYTTIGGLKAVVWTDAIQGIFTLIAIIIVIVLGVIKVGGVGQMFKICSQGQRLEFFNLDPNPFSRNTLWSVVIGYTFMWTVSLTVHPGSTQRFVALPTIKAAQRSVVWFGVGICTIYFLSGFLGLIMYATYSECDPVKIKVVAKNAQVLPLYIQEIGVAFPGLTGLFLSGLTSSALSTLSASLNTLSGTIYEDFIEGLMPKKTTEATASFVMKVAVVIFGLLCVLMVYVIENMGEIMQMQFSLSSAPNSAVFSAFALGLFFPRANSKGVMFGMLASFIFNLWIIIGTNLTLFQHNIVYKGKPTSIAGCPMNVAGIGNITSLANFQEIGERVFLHKDVNKMYGLSFLYYVPLGSIIGIVVGLIVSFFTGGNDLEDLDPKLISPLARGFLPRKKYEEININDRYQAVPQEAKPEQPSS